MTQISINYCYKGPVAAAIFDWAGTVLDFGCIAPVTAFREAFANVGVAAFLHDARSGTWAASALVGVLVGAVWNYALSSRFTWGRY